MRLTRDGLTLSHRPQVHFMQRSWMTANANTPLARSLRRQSNAPEARAWEALRALRAQGFPVRRQFPIGSYIVDFAIPKARLIIEVDGSIHNDGAVRANDERREEDLRLLGWDVMRVSAAEAMSTDHLLARVQAYLGL